MNRLPLGIKATCVAACVLASMLAQPAYTEPVEQETVEAAITLQILEFTEWPEDHKMSKPTPRVIGVAESDNSFAAFQALLSDERFKGRYEIVNVGPETPTEDLFLCDAIFFSKPHPIEIPRLIHKLENRPIVLIGTFEGFLEQGGLVNLIKRQRRLGFEIQLDNSRRRGIEYRAKLLRLAARIVQE